METNSIEPPLIAIVGPTASGKTDLAIRLAKQYEGEIICADSRTVYKHMDIGTAKPTKNEQQHVPHWGLDLVKPGEKFSAADFKKFAVSKIKEIRLRGKVPFLVGGTGLYVDAVLFDYEFGDREDATLREALNLMTIEELHKYCIENNIMLPNNKYNKRYVIRAIEQKSINTKRQNVPMNNSFIVGITTDKELLRTRISRRIEQLFEDGVVDEAIKLGNMYGWDSEAMTGNIYPLVRQYVNGEQTLLEIKEKAITLDWRLAKRQLTWLRRNQYIVWKDVKEAEHYLANILASVQKS